MGTQWLIFLNQESARVVAQNITTGWFAPAGASFATQYGTLRVCVTTYLLHVQLILNCYRAILRHHPDMIMKWDSFLKGIVNSINTRMIQAYGYSPAQILFGFESRYVDKYHA